MTSIAIRSGGAAAFPDWKDAFAKLMPEMEVIDWKTAAQNPEHVDFVLAWEPDGALLRKMTNLKAIISSAVGVDHITRDPLCPTSVPIYRMGSEEIAAQMGDYVLWAAFSCVRNVWPWIRAQREHGWVRPPDGRPTASTTTIGIMGLGNLGRAVATRLVAAGFRVSGWSRSAHDVANVTCHSGEDGFDAFLASVNILVCLLPGTPATSGIMNRDNFVKLPRGAAIINVGRGTHLVEDDLVAALDEGQLSGAVLDVFNTEPLPDDSPLWNHPAVIVTPHAAAEASRYSRAEHARNVITAVLKGEEGPLLYRRERGY